MRMDDIDVACAGQPPSVPGLCQHEAGNEQVFPSAAPQVGDNTTIIDQRFQTLWRVAISDHVDTVHGFRDRGACRMWT